MMRQEDIAKYLYLGIFIIFLILGFIIIKPFITPILSAIVIAYLFNPFYNFLEKHKLKPIFARILVLIIITLIFFGPVIFILSKVIQQGLVLYSDITNSNLINLSNCGSNVVCNYVKKYTSQELTGLSEIIANKIASMLNDFITLFSNMITKAIFNIPLFIFQYAVFLFTTYYLLKDGKQIYYQIKRAIPIKKSLYLKILSIFDNVLVGIIYGNFLIALLQGLLALILYLILHLPSPFFLAFVLTVFAMIPMVGAFFGWFPVALVLLIKGLIIGSSALIIKSIVVFIVGGLIISQVDNFLKPVLVGSKAKIHPLTAFFGIIGGVKLMGVIGLIYGPFILSVTLRLLKTFFSEIRE